MKVYLFKDYLKSLDVNGLTDDHVIAEVESISVFPDSLLKINERFARIASLNRKEDYICIDWAKPPRNEKEAHCCDEIECPHCGYSSGDSWECSDSSDNEKCDGCGSVFSYERVVSVTYSSSIVERNEKVIELKLAGDKKS